MIRKLLGIVSIVALLSPTLFAGMERTQAVTLLAAYNVSAAAYTYSFYRGPDTLNADPLGAGVKWVSKVKTIAGGGTTITAFTAASEEPFIGLVAGDLLMFPNAPTQVNAGASAVNVQGLTQKQERVITTATDNDNAVVNAAIDLSQDSTGYVFYRKEFVTGTETISGWFNVAPYSGFMIREVVTTITGTSIEFKLQCRNTGGPLSANQSDVDIYSFTAAGTHDVYVNLPFDECRLGVQVTGDTGTQSVSAFFIGEKSNAR